MPVSRVPTSIDILAYYNVHLYGAKGDGTTDDTASIQAALNAAGTNGKGAVVYCPPGSYLISSPISVPDLVQIQGTWQAPPGTNGIRDAGAPKPTDGGSTLLMTATGGANDTAAITLGWSSSLKGFCFFYPNQSSTASTPTVFPFTVRMAPGTKNASVRDCCFLNSYQAVDITAHERGLVTDCLGQPISIGINVDACSDITRLRNVHWNPICVFPNGYAPWQIENGIGFQFGRSDEQYCEGLFAYQYKYGIRLYNSNNSYPYLSGPTYGGFYGCSMDGCSVPIQVEATASQGVDIIGGGFITTHNPYNYVQMYSGNLKIVGARFWNGGSAGIVHNGGVLQIHDCQFADRTAIVSNGGTLSFVGNMIVNSNTSINTSSATKATVNSNTLVGAAFSSILNSGSTTVAQGNN